jgi:hypothetical protein
MAALNFPTTGLVAGVTQYTSDLGTTYIWDGVKWVGYSAGGSVGTNSISNNGNTVQVDAGGNLVLPAFAIPNTVGTVGQVLKWPASGSVLAWVNDNISGITYSNANVAAYLVANPQSGTYSNTNVAAYLPTYSGNIAANIVKNSYTWTFGTDGTLTLPVTANGGIITGTGTAAVALRAPAGSQAVLENNAGYNLILAQDQDVRVTTSPDAGSTFNTWNFGTDGKLTFPQGTILSETANSTAITPPNALAGQSLVIRLTGAQGISSDHPGGFTDGDTITITIIPDYNLTPVTGTVDYTFTGATSQQLGRALTGTLTFTSEPSKLITWTIPVSSTMTTFTITLSNASGFDISGIAPLTLTGTGSSEDHHVHLISGDPSITDIYLGDDDQYVKIEKNGGNVVIGTDTNTKQWNFDTDGNLSLPTGGYLQVGSGIVPVSFASSPAPVISGFSTISAENFTFLSNGVNILSTATGTYSNTNVAAYLTTQTFYSNTNVAAYLVANPQGSTYSNTNVAAYLVANPQGSTYSNANVIANLQNLTSNVTTSANVQAAYFVGNGAVLTGITANSYGNIYGTTSNVTLVAGSYSYVFDNTGNLTLPTNGDIILSGTNSILSVSGTTLLGGYSQVGGYYSTLGVKYAGAGTQHGMTLQPSADNTTAINFLNTSGNSIGNITQTASTVKFTGDGSGLSNVAIKTTGSWTVTTGTGTYSFTVPPSGVYQLWVECNIPNGILAYNATATVTNSNVPVVGAQYAWVYTGGGTPVDFTSIPNQFTGTANAIVRSNTAPSATTNRFDFGINNSSGSSQTAYWGYVRID